VCDDDHRVSAAELFDLSDEQLTGPAKINVGHRGGIAAD
jgi:hypothetical protein